jgi:hypothetical protein
MNAFSAWFAKIKSNKYFVTASSLFVGFFAPQAYAALSTGTFNWSLKSIQTMVVTALGLTAMALYHLYLPTPQNPATAIVTVQPPAVESSVTVTTTPVTTKEP